VTHPIAVTSPPTTPAGSATLLSAEAPPITAHAANLRLAIGLFVWVAVYVGLTLLTRVIPNDTLGVVPVMVGDLPLLPLASAVALVGTTLGLIHAGVDCQWPRGWLVAVAVACVLVDNLVHTLFNPAPGFDPRTIILFGFGNVALIGASLFIGKLVAQWVEQPTWIIPICLVAFAVDIWSAFFGPTREVAEAVVRDASTAEAAQRFMIWYPNLRPPGAEELVVKPSFGIGDFIFVALLFQLAALHGLRRSASFWAIFFATLLSMIAAARFSESGLPALPFIVAGFLLVNVGRVTGRPREIAACVIFITVLLLTLIFVVNPTIEALLPAETTEVP
jgi:hypothetical protein